MNETAHFLNYFNNDTLQVRFHFVLVDSINTLSNAYVMTSFLTLVIKSID